MKVYKLKLSLLFIFSILSFNANSALEKYSDKLFIDSTLFSTRISEITIYPVIDNRKFKLAESKIDFKTDFAKVIRAKISGELITIKKYKVNNPVFNQFYKMPEYSNIIHPSKKWIKQLQPESSTHILIIVFSDAKYESSLITQTSGRAEISGYLFDKKSGKLVWKNTYTAKEGTHGLGLLFGLASALTPDYGAIFKALSRAVAGLLDDFPANGISKKGFKKLYNAKH